MNPKFNFRITNYFFKKIIIINILKDLQLDYVDLYLIHWPIAQKPDSPEFGENVEDIPIIDTWREMEVSNR